MNTDGNKAINLSIISAGITFFVCYLITEGHSLSGYSYLRNVGELLGIAIGCFLLGGIVSVVVNFINYLFDYEDYDAKKRVIISIIIGAVVLFAIPLFFMD